MVDAVSSGGAGASSSPATPASRAAGCRRWLLDAAAPASPASRWRPPTTPSFFERCGAAERPTCAPSATSATPRRCTAALAAARPEVVFHLAAQPLVRRSLPRAGGDLRDQRHGHRQRCWRPRATRRRCERGGRGHQRQVLREPRARRGATARTIRSAATSPTAPARRAAELVAAAYRRSFFAADRTARWRPCAPATSSAAATGRGPARARRDARVLARRGRPRAQPRRGPALAARAGAARAATSCSPSGCCDRTAPSAGGLELRPTDEDAAPVSTLAELLVEAWPGERGARSRPGRRTARGRHPRVSTAARRARAAGLAAAPCAQATPSTDGRLVPPRCYRPDATMRAVSVARSATREAMASRARERAPLPRVRRRPHAPSLDLGTPAARQRAPGARASAAPEARFPLAVRRLRAAASWCSSSELVAAGRALQRVLSTSRRTRPRSLRTPSAWPNVLRPLRARPRPPRARDRQQRRLPPEALPAARASPCSGIEPAAQRAPPSRGTRGIPTLSRLLRPRRRASASGGVGRGRRDGRQQRPRPRARHQRLRRPPSRACLGSRRCRLASSSRIWATCSGTRVRHDLPRARLLLLAAGARRPGRSRWPARCSTSSGTPSTAARCACFAGARQGRGPSRAGVARPARAEEAAGLLGDARYRPALRPPVQGARRAARAARRAAGAGPAARAYGAPAKGNTLLNYCGHRDGPARVHGGPEPAQAGQAPARLAAPDPAARGAARASSPTTR